MNLKKHFLSYGLPQGTVLSPFLFLLYVSDVSQWCKKSAKILAFADDFSLSVCGKSKQEVLQQLNENIENIEKYMSANGLKINENKTEFIIFDTKKHNSNPEKVNVRGVEVTENDHVKLLGVIISKDLSWELQLKKVLKEIQSKIGVLNRLKLYLNKADLSIIAQSLVTSTLRYCLPVFGKVRTNEEDAIHEHSKNIQIALNDIVRLISGNKRKDHISIKSLVTEYPWAAFNRLCIECFSIEAWKYMHSNSLEVSDEFNQTYERTTRSSQCKILKAKTVSSHPFIQQSVKLLNMSILEPVRTATNLQSVKNYLRKHLTKFPI